MNTKNKDLRITKSKKAMFEALIEMMREMPFENIKIRDLCSKALVNRSTFYAHYTDIYELLLDFISSHKNSLDKSLDNYTESDNIKEYYINVIKILLDHLEQNKDIYQAILINNRNSIFMDILLDEIGKKIANKLNSNTDINVLVPNDILATFYLGAISSICVKYLNDKNYTKEDILNYLNMLIPNNF